MRNGEALPQATDGRAEAWHALDREEALARLATSADGLTATQAGARLAEQGPNALPETGGRSVLSLVGSQLANPLIAVLIVSAVVAIALGKVLDGAIVAAVVVVNALIGVLQEYRATRAIAALSALVPEHARTRRDGRVVDLAVRELVAGDVVLLASGDKVPADARVIDAHELRVDESALTGESLPVAKGAPPVSTEAALGDRRSMVFKGTFATAGTATVAVVATGPRTELGRISALIDSATDLQTPLTRSLARVAKIITVGVIAVAAAIVAVSMARGAALADALLSSVALAVAAIPEGLPAIVTIALSIGVSRMARRNAVVRRLPAVETLGSTTVICTDKTGTLTRNEMTVQRAWTPAENWTFGGVGYAPEGELHADARRAEPSEALLRLLEHAALCNDGDVLSREGRWVPSGDPTEVALVVAARKAGIAVGELRRTRPRVGVLPFESETRIMATSDAAGRVSLKGAPEALLERCRMPGGIADAARGEAARMADAGLRVLAIAETRLREGQPLDAAAVAHDLELVGLVGMMDPPRPEVTDAVRACREAGVRVVMITGDHPGTARAVGAEIGLDVGSDVVLGAVLDRASPIELEDVVARHAVFARVAPEHKLALVRAIQSRRGVVAMTGDGVNDAPALKQADIGVAMGLAGTGTAREAADMVLADDNFASIAAAVEEGRRVYDNLVKALAFVLPTNLGLALILLVSVGLFPMVEDGDASTLLLPLLPSQILWINLVTTVALALPLAFEAKEPGLMQRPPRLASEPVLGPFVIRRTIIVACLMTAAAIGLFLFEYQRGLPEHGHATAVREAQTMALTTVVLFQVFYVVQCRSIEHSLLEIGVLSNPAMLGGVAAILGLQLLVVYAPPAHGILQTISLRARDLALCVLAAGLLLPLVSLEKWWSRARSHAPRREPSHVRPGGTPQRG